jgi:hypothetical protein
VSDKNDGGSAFPTQGENFILGPQGLCAQSAWGMEPKPGMTLRDWFAGQALAGLSAEGERFSRPECLTKTAFLLADLMLAARKGGAE